MKHIFRKNILLLLLFFWTTSAQCQEAISRAWVEDNRLVVKFNEPVGAKSAKGFRLAGGVARIEALIAGSGTTQLTFSLTDHVLPDDWFSLLYWPELGDARLGSKQLTGQSTVVTNRASLYRGKGTIYYVSTAGNDAYHGTDSAYPLRTIDQAQMLAHAGDYILLKRGDTLSNTFIDVKKSGQPGQYLTFGAYGQGPKPIIEHDWKDIITIADQNYVLIDNLHLKVKGDGETGVYMMGNTNYPVVSNCRVEGSGKPHYGINYGKNDGPGKAVVYPMILNNHVTGFLWNICSSGFPYDGTHEVMGGLIENNSSGKTRSTENGDGIDAQRGKFHGLIIRKNEVYGYHDDGIDLFAADSVIVEYNTVHSPQQPSDSGQGIKAGGITRADKVKGHPSTNVVVRYNTIYNLYNKINDSGSQNGIQTNDGASGKVYGNLVYDVQGSGIVVSGPINAWEVHHNIVVNAGKAGLNIWTEGHNDHKVAVYNNILEGNQGDVKVNTRTTKRVIVGKNNILIREKVIGTYRGDGDRQADVPTLFIDPAKHNFRLKPSYYQYLGTGLLEK